MGIKTKIFVFVIIYSFLMWLVLDYAELWNELPWTEINRYDMLIGNLFASSIVFYCQKSIFQRLSFKLLLSGFYITNLSLIFTIMLFFIRDSFAHAVSWHFFTIFEVLIVTVILLLFSYVIRLALVLSLLAILSVLLIYMLNKLFDK